MSYRRCKPPYGYWAAIAVADDRISHKAAVSQPITRKWPPRLRPQKPHSADRAIARSVTATPDQPVSTPKNVIVSCKGVYQIAVAIENGNQIMVACTAIVDSKQRSIGRPRHIA